MDEEKKNKKIFNIIAWILIVCFASLAYLLLSSWCFNFPWYLVLIIVGSYILALAMNFLAKRGISVSWFFTLLLAVMPVVTVIYMGGWFWWQWLLVIALYVATLITYFVGIFIEKAWITVIPVDLMVALMVLLIHFA